jgi:hypothetical protein
LPSFPMETPAQKFKILLLCTWNASRSIFSEYFMKDIGSGRFDALAFRPGAAILWPSCWSSLHSLARVTALKAYMKKSSWQHCVAAEADQERIWVTKAKAPRKRIDTLDIFIGSSFPSTPQIPLIRQSFNCYNHVAPMVIEVFSTTAVMRFDL